MVWYHHAEGWNSLETEPEHKKHGALKKCGHWGWGREVGKMNWEIRSDICTLPYVRQLSSGKLLCSTRELNSVLCGDQRGGPRDRGYLYT